MNGKNFSTISQQECLYAYKNILTNSDELWISGEILAEKMKFGPAISLSITSIEELIKSLIVLYDGKGLEIRKVKGIDMFFKHHEMRYFIAYFYFIAGALLDECLKGINKVINDPDALARCTEEIKNNPRAVYRRIKIHLLRKFVILKSEMEWFSKADVFRQKGFYSDYENELKTPTGITNNEFNDIIKRLEIVRRTIKGVIKHLENDKNSYEQTILDLKASNFYEELAKELASMRTKRKRLFDFLKED